MDRGISKINVRELFFFFQYQTGDMSEKGAEEKKSFKAECNRFSVLFGFIAVVRFYPTQDCFVVFKNISEL